MSPSPQAEHSDGVIRSALAHESASWIIGLQHLEAFVAEYGHALVPAKYVTCDGYPLGKWVAHKRELFHRKKLTPARKAALEANNFVWQVIDRKNSWARGYKALCDYVASHGDAHVPRWFVTPEGFQLGVWLANRRIDYRRGELCQDRVQLLEDVGVAWSLRRSPSDCSNLEEKRNAKWSTWIQRLVDFQHEHRHVAVPARYSTPDGANLGEWLQTQRQHHKRGILTRERAEELESIGVVWVLRDPTRGRAHPNSTAR